MEHQQNIFLLAVISFFASALLFAGEQSLEKSSTKMFVKEIHGVGHLVAVLQTTDGGYVKVSYKDDPLTVTVSKLSNSGGRIWKNSFQSSNSQALDVSGIFEVSDGYLLTGTVYKSVRGHQPAGLLIKLNTSGKIVWSKYISGPGFTAPNFQLLSASALPDGTFITAGFTYSSTNGPFQPVLMKFGPAGNILWTKRFGKFDSWGIMLSSPTSDNGVLLAVTRTKVFSDGWPHPNRVELTKVNANGDPEWAQTLWMNDFWMQRIRVTSSGNTVLIGQYGLGSQVVSLNKNGHIQWASGFFPNEKMSGGYLGLNDAVQTTDGGHAIVGIISPDWFCGCGDALILKIDKKGKVLFEGKLGSSEDFSDNSDSAQSIFSAGDNGYVIFGQSYEHFVPAGSDPWSQLIIGVNSNWQVSGCNSFTATDTAFIIQEHILKIKTTKPGLKKPFTMSIDARDLNLKSVNVKESIGAICE